MKPSSESIHSDDADQRLAYRERVSKKRLGAMPFENVADDSNSRPVASSKGGHAKGGFFTWVRDHLWSSTLLLGLAVLMCFSLFGMFLSLAEWFQQTPAVASAMAMVLLTFTAFLVALIGSEWGSLRRLRDVSRLRYSLHDLVEKDDRSLVLAELSIRQRMQRHCAYTNSCYQRFWCSVKDEHSTQEIVTIFQDKVVSAVRREAKSQLKQESLAAGGIALIAPNQMLQTMALLWLSLRTMRRISSLFGLRVGAFANIKLLRMALNHLAAGNLTDLLTDELANQLGGSIGDKILANSVDAIAVGSLHQRLGNALINELSAALYE